MEISMAPKIGILYHGRILRYNWKTFKSVCFGAHNTYILQYHLGWIEQNIESWQSDQFVKKKSGVGHGNFHGPERKRILSYERKKYFNPAHMIFSGKLCPIIRNIFKKNIKIHLENPTA